MSIWEKILFKGESPFNGEVKVIESFGVRRLIADGFTQSQTFRDGSWASQRYWQAMVPKEISLGLDARVLVLGLAAGTVVKIITKRFGNITIDGVEIDPLMVELGRKYFDLEAPNLNIVIEDAASFVKEARFKYDLICVDLFMGGSVPQEFQSEEFLVAIKQILQDGGWVTMNKIFSGQTDLEDFEKLVRRVFPTVYYFVIKGNLKLSNVIVYARK